MSKNKTSYKRYSLRKILFNDYFSFLAWMFPVVIFGMSLFIEIFGFFPDLKRGRPPLGVEAIPFFIQLGVITLIIGFIVIIFRVIAIKSYFDKGVELKGKVTGIWVWRVDRGRIYFTYHYKNLEYENSMFVHFHKMTKVFLPNKQIDVLVKPSNPLKAIIKDIFTDTLYRTK